MVPLKVAVLLSKVIISEDNTMIIDNVIHIPWFLNGKPMSKVVPWDYFAVILF